MCGFRINCPPSPTFVVHFVVASGARVNHAHNGDDLLLILAIFGDHTIESETAVIEHVRVTERDKGALCDFWNKSNVAPNRECKKRDLSSYRAHM